MVNFIREMDSGVSSTQKARGTLGPTKTWYVGQKIVWTGLRELLQDHTTFAVAEPRLWNSLPAQLRDPTISLRQFGGALKSHLFLN